MNSTRVNDCDDFRVAKAFAVLDSHPNQGIQRHFLRANWNPITISHREAFCQNVSNAIGIGPGTWLKRAGLKDSDDPNEPNFQRLVRNEEETLGNQTSPSQDALARDRRTTERTHG